MADVEADFGPAMDGTDPTEVFVIEEDGRGIGIIQRYRFDDDPEWDRVMAVGARPRPAMGLDYLIGVEERTGKGLGAPIIAEFVDDRLDRFPDIRAVVVDVDQANRRSWRILEKAGFRRDWSGTIESRPTRATRGHSMSTCASVRPGEAGAAGQPAGEGVMSRSTADRVRRSSMAAASTGREKMNPWPRSHCSPRRPSSCSGVLDALGQGHQPEGPTELDQRVDEGGRVGASVHLGHERAVDLEHVDGELAQVGQRGIAGAEVVDGDHAPRSPSASSAGTRWRWRRA